MERVIRDFAGIHVSSEVITILLRRERLREEISYKRLGKYLRKAVSEFIAGGHYINGHGLLFAHLLNNLGYPLPSVYLAHKIASMGVTSHYFSLIGEGISSFFREDFYEGLMGEGLKSFSSSPFRRLRLCLAILSEMRGVDALDYVSRSLRLSSKDDIDVLPPLVILLIKAAAASRK